jgi:toxin-antitoxin system PIN domain toxin
MSERGGSTARRGAADLLAVNVWLALAIEEHPHHRAAVAYWTREAAMPRRFCRVSVMSLVRLLARPRLMGNQPLTLPKAWTLYRSFAALPGVALLAEPADLDAGIESFVTPGLPPRLFTDACFAALARSTGSRLVTFDKGFERFERPDLLRLAVEDI